MEVTFGHVVFHFSEHIVSITPFQIVKDGQVQYDPHAFGSSHGMGVLNDRHSYFLLADNGTSSR